ncbi:NAD(P)H-binding protein [Sphingobacterium sp. JB170]|uniref:NAD(P)H-binding protein n=1 Tax=Sphingobacterium sp. JB170 TaxID=1434842 RepID=UPI00097F47C9|nr:NAD(P)H-binding protein [Sphingobacterium sp. JB170]SJN15606.1 Oxidoreductase [Sphingobacterium sp. JB170]
MKAVIIGATGATGKEVLKELLADKRITAVIALVRREINNNHSKLTVIKVDFENLQNYESHLHADIAFSCLGTTLKDAGSKEAQWIVDHDYQLHFAALCKSADVKHFVLLSALGASKDAYFFYSRMKGTLEDHVSALNFPQLTIIQPGMITRPNSTRKLEQITGKILQGVNKIGLLSGYRAITTHQLAKEIVKAGFVANNTGIRRLAGQDLFNGAV